MENELFRKVEDAFNHGSIDYAASVLNVQKEDVKESLTAYLKLALIIQQKAKRGEDFSKEVELQEALVNDVVSVMSFGKSR